MFLAIKLIFCEKYIKSVLPGQVCLATVLALFALQPRLSTFDSANPVSPCPFSSTLLPTTSALRLQHLHVQYLFSGVLFLFTSLGFLFLSFSRDILGTTAPFTLIPLIIFVYHEMIKPCSKIKKLLTA
jgi:hypothetical protein